MSFATANELETKVKNIGWGSVDVPARWDTLLAEKNTAAYNVIVAHLRKRGYTLAQIANWVLGKQFQLDLGAYFVLREMYANTEHDDVWIEKYNVEAALDEIAILDSSGEEVDGTTDAAPDLPAINTDSDDRIFTRDTTGESNW